MCWFGFVFIVDVHMCHAWKGCWLGDREWMVVQQKRVRKGKSCEKGERKGKSGLREKSVFLFLCDCVFHPILSPIFVHIHICGLLPEYQLTACYPHSPKREMGTLARWLKLFDWVTPSQFHLALCVCSPIRPSHKHTEQRLGVGYGSTT